MPRVVVPFTNLHPVTKQVLDNYGLNVEYVHLEGDDGYRQLMKRLWNERKDVVIVEHDIVPWPGAIEELVACPCTWGTYSYELLGGIGVTHGFGCAKLTRSLMDCVPDVWDAPLKWDILDQKLFFTARTLGIEPHLHRPPVVHLSGKHQKRGQDAH